MRWSFLLRSFSLAEPATWMVTARLLLLGLCQTMLRERDL
jgi:hypothetical protein